MFIPGAGSQAVRLAHVRIQNVLSYGDTRFDFRGYDVIIGPNGAGKTNLMRILGMVRGGPADMRLPRGSRLDPDAPSELDVGIAATAVEEGVARQALLAGGAPREGRAARGGEIRVFARWDGQGGGDAPEAVQAYVGGRLGAALDGDGTVAFDIGGTGMGPADAFDATKSGGPGGTEERLGRAGIRNAERVEEGIDVREMLSGGTGTVEEAVMGGAYLRSLDAAGRAEAGAIAAEVRRYSGDVAPRDPRATFRALLRAIVSNGLTLVGESCPADGELATDLLGLKMADEGAYGLLKDRFALLSGGAAARVEGGGGQEDAEVIIEEGGREARMADTAAGHRAMLHMLLAMRGGPGGAVVLDCPEAHLHPARARHLGAVLAGAAAAGGSQAVVLTRSPELADHGMLDPASPRGLARVARAGGASRAFALPAGFRSKLGPHLFDPRILLGSASLIVEGPGDVMVMRAVSDALGGALERRSVTLVDCASTNNVGPYVELHERLGIPHVAMVDGDCGAAGGTVVLKGRMEDELRAAGWEGGAHIAPDRAYGFVRGLLGGAGGLEKLKATGIWKAFAGAVEAAGGCAEELGYRPREP